MPSDFLKCPKCEGTSIAVEVKTWCNFDRGEPRGFDEEDVESVEPSPGGECICRECQHRWIIPPDVSKRDRDVIALAHEQRARDGDIEFDQDAKVSEGDDNGAYVQAWVWIDFSGTELDKVP